MSVFCCCWWVMLFVWSGLFVVGVLVVLLCYQLVELFVLGECCVVMVLGDWCMLCDWVVVGFFGNGFGDVVFIVGVFVFLYWCWWMVWFVVVFGVFVFELYCYQFGVLVLLVGVVLLVCDVMWWEQYGYVEQYVQFQLQLCYWVDV